MQKVGLSKKQVLLMSVTAGVCVANIYYNQPILKTIAVSLQATEQQAGTISVLTQAGYGLGLFFLTPLGDKLNRKKLILVLQVLLVLALACVAFIQTIGGMYVISLLIGLLSVVAQVILPMAASLVVKDKGKTVGFIFTGILVGILAARVFSGYITEWLGWRAVFESSALMVLITTVMMAVGIPDVSPHFKGNYTSLLQSTLQQVKRFALLRRTAVVGALAFGTFCSFWTTLTFHLGGPPFRYNAGTIGLFGVLAIAGALLAPVFGKLADKGNPLRSQVFSVSLIVVAVLLVLLFPWQVSAFIAATVFLDVGVQATQVTNIATIYTLDETAHSRINTVYMTMYFIGGAVGTTAGVWCWEAGGWPLVSWQLLTWSTMALLLVSFAFWRKKQTAVQPTERRQPSK
ncbi:MAG TPA: MFS transporter [Flavisolibacter sp.]|nr:MFS transporter [Flavisolibacter sp.]